MTIDVDQTWDGKGSLDDHRQEAFKTLQQVPFGQPAKPPEPAPVVDTPADEPTDAT